MTANGSRDVPFIADVAMLPLVLETALDAVMVMGGDGVVTAWNGQAEAVFGWSRAEAIGRQLAELIIPPGLRQAHRDGLNRFHLTGEGPLLGRRIEVTALRKSGAEFPIELSISAVRSQEANGFLGFVRDITQRRQAEELLRRQAREAEILNEISSLAADTGSVDEILKACLSAVCELTGWPAGHAYVPSATVPARLTATGVWHGDPAQFAELQTQARGTFLEPGEGLAGRIWLTRAPSWQAERPGEAGSAFGFPIMSGGEVVAVLEFFSRDTPSPDPRLTHLIETLGGQVGRVLERRRVQEHQALLLAELDHRARNMLAVVMSMADQTARRAESIPSFKRSFSARLSSLARGYGLITAHHWGETSLEAIIREIVSPYLAEGLARMEISGETVVLAPKAALAVAMVFHELVTNAIKHGALSTPEGQILIRWSIDGPPGARAVALEWCETGLKDLRSSTRRGFGSRLIDTTLKRELNGQANLEFRPEGIRYVFAFPEPGSRTPL